MILELLVLRGVVQFLAEDVVLLFQVVVLHLQLPDLTLQLIVFLYQDVDFLLELRRVYDFGLQYFDFAVQLIDDRLQPGYLDVHLREQSVLLQLLVLRLSEPLLPPGDVLVFLVGEHAHALDLSRHKRDLALKLPDLGLFGLLDVSGL